MIFTPFPKLARLNRDIVITEKIDGTNAQLFILPLSEVPEGSPTIADVDGLAMLVGSRTRWITPKNDNHGFARWAEVNSDALIMGLGPGQHFGEWWGNGIQRTYGLPNGDKRFSLFNVGRWNKDNVPLMVSVVPTLYSGPFSLAAILDAQRQLREQGSVAAPGFLKPEGIVIYHVAAQQLFKVTLENDAVPKGKVAA